jgi:hypothetical protein
MSVYVIAQERYRLGMIQTSYVGCMMLCAACDRKLSS